MRRPADALRKGLVDALLGLLPGAALGWLAAGGYATWRVGGDLSRIDFTTFLAFAPEVAREPAQTAALIGAGVALACAGAAAALGYRPALDAYGVARWATQAELRRAGMLRRLGEVKGPILGKTAAPRRRGLYFSTDRTPHSLIAAPTGSGKGVGVVIPTLLTYPGSVVVLDVKGENFRLTSRRRAAMGDRVFKFEPYDEAGCTHRFNPVDMVAGVRPARRFSEARRLATALIVANSQSAAGFLAGAREIFAACVVHAMARDTPTIGAVYDLLSGRGAAQEVFAAMAAATDSAEAAAVFNRMADTETRVLSSYLSVLMDGGLSLWGDGAVRDATAASDFDIVGLRRSAGAVYLVVSPNDLETLAPLIRLIFQQGVAMMQRAEPTAEEAYPVLFVLDEFGALGRMDVLSSAITTLRSFGGRIMIVVQSMAHLRQHYGQDGATNFLANTGAQLFMAPSDAETPDYVSRAIGDFTRRATSRSWRRGELGGMTLQEREEGAALLRPEALRKLGDDEAVILLQGADPARVRKVRYFEDRDLMPLFEAQSGPLPEPPALPQEGRAAMPAAPVVAPERTGLAPQARPAAAPSIGETPAAPAADDADDARPLDEPASDEAHGLRIVRGKQSGIAAGIREGRRRRALREAKADAEDRAAMD